MCYYSESDYKPESYGIRMAFQEKVRLSDYLLSSAEYDCIERWELPLSALARKAADTSDASQRPWEDILECLMLRISKQVAHQKIANFQDSLWFKARQEEEELWTVWLHLEKTLKPLLRSSKHIRMLKSEVKEIYKRRLRTDIERQATVSFAFDDETNLRYLGTILWLLTNRRDRTFLMESELENQGEEPPDKIDGPAFLQKLIDWKKVTDKLLDVASHCILWKPNPAVSKDMNLSLGHLPLPGNHFNYAWECQKDECAEWFKRLKGELWGQSAPIEARKILNGLANILEQIDLDTEPSWKSYVKKMRVMLAAEHSRVRKSFSSWDWNEFKAGMQLRMEWWVHFEDTVRVFVSALGHGKVDIDILETKLRMRGILRRLGVQIDITETVTIF